MRNLKLEELETINGGIACALSVIGFFGSLASLIVAPATGGASLLLSQGMIATSTASMGVSCSGDAPVQQ
ncbi:class IIb bacteriocin, lactobin A/cerein 7B family [Aquimarina sp. AU474]|uniref:class IIb bacteriocin, lactobin A/cerein 7B family n=1 Tax=Aquimarina sp. AU474 TaxID=2108529 RepID=UPI000D69C19E|nr:class IIb bacteriocin, lactobin A/cerein 7B family [Aquimarina sp. AU474]